MDFSLTDEERLVQETVRDLAENNFKDRAKRVDEEQEFPQKNISELAELGLLGSIISEEYGGASTSLVTYSVLLEEIARACASTSVIVSVTTMVGKTIEKNGTNEHKEKYVTRIATGKTLGAFCLTEPQAGSDPSSMRTTALKDQDSYILNGQKLWITNAAHSEILLVMASEDLSLGRKGISAFIVDKKDLSGGELVIGKPENKMGLHGSHTCAVFFENLEIPVENRIAKKGDGLKIAFESLNTGRIGIASQAIGIGQAAFEATLAYAKEREQFGKTIGKFQGISFKISEMKMKLEASRLLARRAAWMDDQGLEHTMESSIAKAFSTESAFDVTAEAIRVFGGMGYSKEFLLERYLRDVQATLLYEGTNEIQRLIIARNLGL